MGAPLGLGGRQRTVDQAQPSPETLGDHDARSYGPVRDDHQAPPAAPTGLALARVSSLGVGVCAPIGCGFREVTVSKGPSR